MKVRHNRLVDAFGVDEESSERLIAVVGLARKPVIHVHARVDHVSSLVFLDVLQSTPKYERHIAEVRDVFWASQVA